MKYTREVHIRCSRINPNKKKGQSKTTTRKLWWPLEDAEVGKRIKFKGHEWTIDEIIENPWEEVAFPNTTCWDCGEEWEQKGPKALKYLACPLCGAPNVPGGYKQRYERSQTEGYFDVIRGRI